MTMLVHMLPLNLQGQKSALSPLKSFTCLNLALYFQVRQKGATFGLIQDGNYVQKIINVDLTKITITIKSI